MAIETINNGESGLSVRNKLNGNFSDVALFMTESDNADLPTIRPTLDLDFVNGATVDPRITFTRASTTTYYDGKTFAKAEENLLLNSATLATQNVATTAQPYTLSFEGTGTVTLSGTSTAGPLVGSTGRVTLTFTPTAGTLTLTVTGTVTNAQLEARSQATAYTPTTTQPITRYQPQLLTAPANTAVIDHDPVTGARLGLRVWEARTNLLTRSEEFDNASWVKTGCTVAANVGISPSGAQSLYQLVEDTSNGVHNIFQSVPAANGTYTLSVFAKTRGRRLWINMSDNATGDVFAVIDLVTGQVVSGPTVAGSWTLGSASVISMGNGLYRCSLTATKGAGSVITASFRGAIGTAQVYTGDGVSGIYPWGAQLEAGNSASPYIPTTTAQVTRAADVASMTGANFSSWYRQDEGSLYAEAYISTVVSDLFNAVAGLHQASGNLVQLLALSKSGSSPNSFRSFTRTADGVIQAQIHVGTAPTSRALNKIAGCYKTNDFAAAIGGGSVGVDTSAVLPLNITRLVIGADGIGGAVLNGHIRHITYYPARLSNATLQAITKP